MLVSRAAQKRIRTRNQEYKEYTRHRLFIAIMSIVVISGGTATNDIVSLFNSLSQNITYILPISDNGGSTLEIIRVIGGPAIGDIRSRLTRLIPPNQEALRNLLSYRLSSEPKLAKFQWNEIVDGSHELWGPISTSTKEIIRAFFIHVHTELLKRSKTTNVNKQFRYELANVGNLFLTGVRLFIGSLDSAIELFIRITGINPDIQVLPCINTNFPYHISAVLESGLVITGQSQISHPSESCNSYPPRINKTRPPSPTITPSDSVDGGLDTFVLPKPRSESFISTISSIDGDDINNEDDDDDEESGNTPQYIHPALKISQLHVSKTENIEPLLSPIERIFYISPYGEEICPIAHGRATAAITQAKGIIFSIGSLMTSVVPVVILKGVGKAILNNTAGNKILLLNGCHDRETDGMCAADFVELLVKLTEYSTTALGATAAAPAPNVPPKKAANSGSDSTTHLPWNLVVSHLVHLKDSLIKVDSDFLNSKGVKCIEVKRIGELNYYDPIDLEKKLKVLVN